MISQEDWQKAHKTIAQAKKESAIEKLKEMITQYSRGNAE